MSKRDEAFAVVMFCVAIAILAATITMGTVSVFYPVVMR